MGGVPSLGPVTEFLASLSPTGAAGFEGLVARLCEAATGQRFRLSGSGQQSGQDARAEPGQGNRIKVESKRYGRDTALDLRELTSELTQATTMDPDLDLWVLAASRPVIDQIARSLEQLAGGLGVEVLFLDMGTDSLPRLPVLMAAYVGEVQEWISTHCLPESGQLLPALAALAADASFSGIRAQILSKLVGTMLGYENARRRCKTALNDVLSSEGKTRARFGQRLDIRAPGSRVISRAAVKAQLDRCQGGQNNRAVVLGEEGSGKTWAVMDWLAGATEAEDFPVALAFSAKVEPISGSDTLVTLVPRLLAGWTGIGTEAFWMAKLKRWAADPDTRGPRLMVFCDGLSERALNWPLFFRALEDPQWAGLISVILTDRPEHWRSLRSGMFGYCEIQVDGYDERELHHALEGGNVQLEEIPPDLHPLIRKPRYCDLVCEHFEEMKRESDFTVGRLIWMDVKYRRESKLGFPMSEDDFVAVIQGIAKRHRADALFDLDSVKRLLPCPDPDGQIYREILDGLLERRTGVTPKFYAKEAHLVFGLGMLIADEVRETAGTASSAGEISDQIGRWFEPHHEMDLKVKICEAALFHAFLDSEYPSAGREELLRHWLRLRNTTASAQEAFAKYVVRGPKEFIRVAEGLFAEEQYMGIAEDFFVKSFSGYRDEPSVGPVLARAIDRWLRQIHPCGDAAWSSDAAYREKERNLVSGRIGREACAGPVVIAGEQLVFIEDYPLLRLAGLAFKVISKGARAPFLSSLAGWAVGAAIAGSRLMKEFGWLLRLSEDDIATRLIAHAETLLNRSEEVAHVAAHILLDALGTEGASALAESCPLPESEFEQRCRLEREADPCTSWLPWSDDDCLRCMERNDVGVVYAIRQAGSRIFDLDYPVPSSLLQRAVALLDEIPRSVHSGTGQTLQDHNFNQISPLLESREPHGLANFIRSVIRTMPERNIEAQRILSFWLPRVGPLLRASEVEAITRSLEALHGEPQHWTPISPGKVTTGQWIEVYSLLGVLPHLGDDEFVEWTLDRPDNGFDDVRLDHLARPLTALLGRRVLALIHANPSRNKLGRALRLLKATNVPLSDIDRERLAQLAISDDWYVRASCLRFVCEVGDHELGKRILSLGQYFGNACWMEEDWGSRLVLGFSAHLGLDEIASRVHPAVLAHCLEPRGNRPEEVRTFGVLLEKIFEQVLGASDPDGIVVPRLILPPVDWTLGIESPRCDEPEYPRIKVDERSPDALREFFARLNNFLSGQGDAEVNKMNAERWARVDAVRAAWKTTALNWYGRRLDGTALRSLHEHSPSLVEKWVRQALQAGPDGVRSRVRLGGVYAGLSIMLMSRSPRIGCLLWLTLYGDRENFGVEVTIEYPFAAADSLEVADVRLGILDECWDDAKVAQIAHFCDRHGRQVWMTAAVDTLIADPLLWRRAKGLALTSFACAAEDEFDRNVERANIHETWVWDQVEGFRNNVRSNLLAQNWYRRFLRSNDPDEWWSAFQIVRRCGDERFWTWRSLIEAEDGSVNLTVKLAYLAVNRDDIEKEFDRAADRQKTFCGLDIENVKILPFDGGR